MPQCRKCSADIRSGRYCPDCARDDLWADEFELVGEDVGPEMTECDHCRGRCWVWDGDRRVDCPVCGGIGKVEVVVDGGGIDPQQAAARAEMHLDLGQNHIGPEKRYHYRQAAQLVEAVREAIKI